jgi:hypothetical protein
MAIRILLCALLLATAGFAETPDFYAHWGDGRAEISSYRVVQPRYGEMREGYGVLIFVTEDINRRTFIKVESPTAAKDRVYVLKLNNVLKFTTGIYDYSAMTSVFSAVEGLVSGDPFELCKVSLSSQEWCGHVFDEVQRQGGELQGEINSYFESEGKNGYELKVGDDFEAEDNLLIRIRELKGSIMKAGEERKIDLLPSLWSFRLAHRPHGLVRAVLRKGNATTVGVGEAAMEAVPWSWGWDGFEKTAWVEKAYPHRILRWEDSSGGKGELIETVREPYWSLKRNADRGYRERLGIPR